MQFSVETNPKLFGIVAALVVLFCIIVFFVACASPEEAKPVQPAVTALPLGVYTFCHEGNRVYYAANYHRGGIAVVGGGCK